MIPKILHYVWFGPYNDTQTCVNDWQNVCPDYKVIRWTNENLKPYLDQARDLFGKDTLNAKTMTYVSDLVRLLIIKDYGGVYLDHDIVLIKDITPLIEQYNMVLTFQYKLENANNKDVYGRGETLVDILEKGYGTSLYHSDNVNNCFIAVTPKHKLIDRAIELTLSNHTKPKELQYPMSDWGVGPSVFTELINEFGISTQIPKTQIKDDVVVYSSDYLHPLHGVERTINGREEYRSTINKIISDKKSYAVHLHEHFGATMFLNKKITMFNDWYKN